MSIIYQSDGSTGWDSLTAGTLPTGWAVGTNVSPNGSWALEASSTASPLVTGHALGQQCTSGTTHGTLVLSSTGTLTDCEIVATQIITVQSSSFTFNHIWSGLRGNAAGTTGYLFACTQSGMRIYAQTAAESYTTLSTNSSTNYSNFTDGGLSSMVEGGTYVINTRFAISGTTLMEKAWLASYAEPADWVITVTSSLFASGYPYLFNSDNTSTANSPNSIMDLIVLDSPSDGATALYVQTPVSGGSSAQTISGTFTGTAPSGLAYALNGASSFTAVTSPVITTSGFSFPVSGMSVGQNQLAVQAANATTEVASTAGFGVTNASTITVATPSATAVGAAISLSGTYSGTAPTGIAYAYDGGSSFAAATGFSASSGSWSASTAADAPAAGTHTITVQSSGDTTITATSGSFTSYGPLDIAGTPSAATVGVAYSWAPTVTGGNGTKSFAITGTLPAGLAVSATSGVVTGTPTTAGTSSDLAITVTDSSGTATISGLSITVAAAATALAIGVLTATSSASAITLAVSAALSGGSGTGYSYSVYRSLDPNNMVLLDTVTSLPYTDSTAQPGSLYFYSVIGTDGAGATAYAQPSGFAARGWSPSSAYPIAAELLATPTLSVVFIGDSITYSAYVTNEGTTKVPSMPGYCVLHLGKSFGYRSIQSSNCGVGGLTSADWLPTMSYFPTATKAMASLLAATPDSIPVFSMMLGTNDSSSSNHTGVPMTQATYITNMKTIIAALLEAQPSAIIVLHKPPAYSSKACGH